MHEVNKAALKSSIEAAVNEFAFLCEEPNFEVKANIVVSYGFTQVEIFEERN